MDDDDLDFEITDDDFDFTENERERLDQLWRLRGKKFDEICTHVAVRLGYEVDPATASEELKAQIRDEAKESVRQWNEDVASSRDLKQLDKADAPEPGLQQLLAEHHQLAS
jgi:hypothetical protein